MKKVLPVLLSVLLLSCLVFPAAAADTVAVGEAYELVMDEADLLTDEEEASLLASAREISQRQECDVVLVTTGSLGDQSAEAYADDYFDYNGYGYGPDRSGILFLISMEDRDWHISTRGDAIQAFSDDTIEYMVDGLISDLSGGYYYDAFRTYFETADSVLSVYRGTASDEEIDDFNQGLDDYVAEHGHWGEESARTGPRSYLPSILLALVIGFIIAFIPMSVLKAQVNNVRQQHGAANYIRKDSMHLDVSRDLYLYANTTSRVIETENRSGGGGGSSTHISSSGATHGGHGGKF